MSRSVDFLKRTGRIGDLDFILAHIDDLHAVFTVRNGEVQMIPARNRLAPTPLRANRDRTAGRRRGRSVERGTQS